MKLIVRPKTLRNLGNCSHTQNTRHSNTFVNKIIQTIVHTIVEHHDLRTLGSQLGSQQPTLNDLKLQLQQLLDRSQQNQHQPGTRS